MPEETTEVKEKKAETSKKSPEKSKISEEEFEGKVIELAEKGMTSEKIGETLRKQGIHSREYKKKISEILKKHGKYTIPELKNVEKKLEKIVNHAKKNRQDKRALRDKDRTFAKLRRIKSYFSK